MLPILHAVKNAVLLFSAVQIMSWKILSTKHSAFNLLSNLFSHLYSFKIYPSAKENFWSL